jgi:hypothetical protein
VSATGKPEGPLADALAYHREERKHYEKAPGEPYAMSPQAQRRLQRTMTDGELRDLAHDIAEAIEAASPHQCVVLGEEERAAILGALMVDR